MHTQIICLVCRALFVLKIGLLLSATQTAHSYMPHLLHHMLFLGCLAVWCLAFQVVLSTHLVLQRNSAFETFLFVFYFYWIMNFGNRILNTLNGINLPSLLVPFLYIIWDLLWVVLDSNLEKITDFTWSKFKYLIFSESKILPLSSCFLVWGSSYWTLWTALYLCGDLWPCLCLCVFLHSAFNWFPFPHLLHVLPYTGHCFFRYLVPQHLQIFIHFFSFMLFFAAYSDLVLCLSLLIKSVFCISYNI